MKNCIIQLIYQKALAALGRLKTEIVSRKQGVVAESLTSFEHPLDATYQHKTVVFEIPTEHVYYPYQFGYAINAWHPFVKTLLEYVANPYLAYEDSILCAYYQNYQPKTVRDVFLFGETAEIGRELYAFPVQNFLPFLPWVPAVITYARGEHGLGPNEGHQGFGPVSKAKGELEFKRLVETFKSIQKYGYQPIPGRDGEITGYFIRHEDNYRFIIRSGLHRTAVLSALGHTMIRVKCTPGYPRCIHTAFVEEWPLIKQGKISIETALTITKRFFTDDGKAKAKLIGLLT